MTAALASIPWSTLIAGGVALLLVGVVGVTIRSILKGDLVPRSVLADEKERADKLEAAWQRSEDRIDAFEGRLDGLTQHAELHTDLLQKLVERARR